MATAKNTATVETEEITEEAVNPIPQAIIENGLIVEFCKMYLGFVNEIGDYNKSVLQTRTDGWTNSRVLEKAKEFASPTDANIPKDDVISDYFNDYEKALSALAHAKTELLNITAEKLGITLNNTAERDPNVENELKEKRVNALKLVTQLEGMADMTHDAALKEGIREFLKNSPLPMVGRDQVRSFGLENATATTPKYRITVTVFNQDGEKLYSDKGFSKAAQAITKPVFGYERGKAPDADVLRNAWEKAGNSADNPYAVPRVEFVDNKLTYVIEKSA